MKFTNKTKNTIFYFILLGVIAGTLGWEILERYLSYFNFDIDLAVGPIGFDLSIISLYIKINPGSLLGALGGFYLFKTL